MLSVTVSSFFNQTIKSLVVHRWIRNGNISKTSSRFSTNNNMLLRNHHVD
jgi:hypothetical protein